MSSTSISALSTYNTPGLTERCGEVYCSVNLESFFINCLRCSLQFSLLSCDLFIVHIKECLPAVLHDLAEPNCLSPKAHDLDSNNSTKDDLETSECTIQEKQVDPLMTIKNESEEADNTDDACEDVEDPSNYENDDDLSLEKLRARKIVEGVISEYKKHPILWDIKQKNKFKKAEITRAYTRIRRAINSKYKTNFSHIQLRTQIQNLRCRYRKVLNKKKAFDKCQTDGTKQFETNLWFFDKLHFIDENNEEYKDDLSQGVESEQEGSTSGDENQPLKKINHPTKQEEALEINEMYNADNNHSMDHEKNYENCEKESTKECDNGDLANDNPTDVIDEPVYCGKKNKKIVLSLIQEYKKHPCLWNSHEYSPWINRYDAVKEITSAINTKHNTNFTNTRIKKTLVNLRRSYKRALRIKEAFELRHSDTNKKFVSPLWCFYNMAFIGGNGSDFPNSRIEKTKSDLEDESQVEESETEVSDEDIESDNFSECQSIESEMKSVSEYSKSCESPITANKPLLRAIIEEYKTKPCLWDVNSEEITRERDLTEICNVINEKFSTKLNYQSLDSDMTELISSYKRMLQTQETGSNDDLNSKIWYADLLSFINKSESNESCGKNNEHIDLPEERPVIIDNNSCDDEEEYKSSRPVPNKETVFKIIEVYKEATSLWDTNHPQHKMQSVRRRCIGGIIAKLSQEHDIHITLEEFRYHIQFLKSAYFRAVRQEAIAKQSNLSSMGVVEKPFYFEEMSFLEPFADKNPPDLQIREEKPHQFTFLCENKSLMVSFINLYKANRCLWDQAHKDRNNPSAHSKAHRKIIKLFKQNGEHFPKKRLLSAIRFLHSTVVDAQDTIALNEENKANKSPVWFYEHLNFLGKMPPITDRYCTHCDKHFPSLNEYEKHKIEITGDYPYKCKICNAGFVSRSKCSYHQLTHKEPHKCELCGFQAYDNHNFDVHMRRHKRILLFRCDECEKGFVTSSELNRHLRKHTGEKSFVCEICGLALAASSEYYHHMKRHRNERDHKCEICGSAFFTAKTLRCHMATHSSERQHVCDICGSTFKRKKTLCQHMALHSENKKYSCNICGRRFAQKSGQHSHMKTHGQKI